MDPAPRPSLVRRLPLAVLVALAVAALFGGAIGFATAAGEDAVFTVPAPLGGDKAVYTVSGPGRSWEGQEARIEVRAAEPLLLPDGSWASTALHRAGIDVARSSVEFEGGSVEFSVAGWTGALVDASTQEGVASLRASGSSSQSSSSTAFLDPLGGEAYQQQSVRMTTRFEVDDTPCAVRSPLQTVGVQAGDQVTVEGCGDTYVVEGMRPYAGGEALLLRGGDSRLWYQAGIPYPVRFDWDVGGDEPSSWELTGFERGTKPLVPGPVPAPVYLAPIATAATSRLGPDASGLPVRFPLQEAVQHAIDYSNEVEEFVADHPDWFLRWADYREEEADGERSGAWTFTMRGDQQELTVYVIEPDDSSAIPAGVDGLLGDVLQAAGQSGSNAVFVSGLDGPAEPEWPQECRPAQLPSVGALASRWAQAERRPVGEANAYQFYLGCFGFEDVVQPSHTVAAGDNRIVQPPSSDDPLEPTSANSTQVLRMLQLDEHGELTLETTETAISRESWGAFGSPTAASGAMPIERGSTATWSRPAAPVAAGITLLSLFAGLAYWLWPTLKAGPLALFSRLQGPQVLAHPVRQELLQRIEAHPGVHYQDLVRAMDKGRGAIEHHLRKLQEVGQVKALSSGGYTCWFPVAYDRRLAAAAPALKSAGARAVLAAIQARPGGSATDVGAATGLSPAAINHHLQRLSAAGLVSILRAGRSLHLTATPLAGKLGPAVASAA